MSKKDNFVQLLEREKTLSLIYNSSSDLISLVRVEKDGNLNVESINSAMDKIFRRTGVMKEGESLLGMSVERMYREKFGLSKEDVQFRMGQFKKCLEEKREVYFENQTNHPDQSGLTYHLSRITPVLNDSGECARLLVTVQDISEYMGVKKKIEEKNALLKESHHRIKNNLQVVSSLLAFQSRQIKDEQVKAKFQESKDRIRAIALVHEKLYQSQSFASIKAEEYLGGILELLKNSLDPKGKTDISANIGDFYLDQDLALPCGLILNEAVSNSFKHACGEASTGKINLSFQKQGGNYELIIQDNGKADPQARDVKAESNDSLGLELMKTFAEQLKGQLSFSRQDGFKVCLTFKEGA